MEKDEIKVGVLTNEYLCKFVGLEKEKLEEYFFVERMMKLFSDKNFREKYIKIEENGNTKSYRFAFVNKDDLK